MRILRYDIDTHDADPHRVHEAHRDGVVGDVRGVGPCEREGLVGADLDLVDVVQRGFPLAREDVHAFTSSESLLSSNKQVRGSISPDELAARLSYTAIPLNWNDGYGTYQYLAPVAQKGGGLVNAFAAAHGVSVRCDVGVEI